MQTEVPSTIWPKNTCGSAMVQIKSDLSTTQYRVPLPSLQKSVCRVQSDKRQNKLRNLKAKHTVLQRHQIRYAILKPISVSIKLKHWNLHTVVITTNGFHCSNPNTSEWDDGEANIKASPNGKTRSQMAGKCKDKNLNTEQSNSWLFWCYFQENVFLTIASKR